MRTNVYVDGFNLYYGCLKETPYRWLDLAQFCRFALPKNAINHIRYFTARVQALQTIPNLSVHYGHYLESVRRMPLANPPVSGPRTVEVLDTEEKGSDVNLAAYLLLDGFQGDYEVAVAPAGCDILQTGSGRSSNSKSVPRDPPGFSRDHHQAGRLVACRFP